MSDPDLDALERLAHRLEVQVTTGDSEKVSALIAYARRLKAELAESEKAEDAWDDDLKHATEQREALKAERDWMRSSRDAARADTKATEASLERVGADRDRGWTEAVRLEEQIATLRAALEDAIYTVVTGRKGSIGSIDNVYLPQVYVTRVEKWRKDLEATKP